MSVAPLPIPADFAEYGAGRTANVAAHYGVAECTIRKWRRQTGVRGTYKQAPQNGPRPRQRLPIPDGFADYLAGHSMREASHHFELSRKAVERMMDDLGIPRKRGVYSQRAATAAAPKLIRLAGYRSAPVVQKRAHLAANHVTRDDSLEGRAADFLRCATRAAINRCNEAGRADPQGSCWRYGIATITGAELIARAERHGFVADGWCSISTSTNESLNQLISNDNPVPVMRNRDQRVVASAKAGA